MLLEIAKAALGIAVILGVWLAIQLAWRRVFAAPPGDDVLAGRLGCHDCTCESPCERRNRTETTMHG